LLTEAQVSMLSFYGVTVGAPALVSAMIDLGPIEQYKQSGALRDEVIEDQEVIIEGATDEEMLVAAYRLRNVIEKLD